MLFLAQHISNHGIALRTVFAKVSDPPEKTKPPRKQSEYMNKVLLHGHIKTQHIKNHYKPAVQREDPNTDRVCVSHAGR